MKNIKSKAAAALLYLLIVSVAMLFLPAWTLNYWQAWVYIAIFMVSISAIVIYLVKKDPELLARRMNNTEGEKSQKIIHFLVNLAFVAVTVFPVLDHRFG